MELCGISLFGNTTIGLLLFFTHLLACLTVGFLFRFWKYNDTEGIQNLSTYQVNKKTPPSINSLGSILQSSIMSSVSTVVMIGGFVMLFSVIISILNNSNILNILGTFVSPIFSVLHVPTEFINGTLSGIVELTNGVSIISNIPIKSISINITI